MGSWFSKQKPVEHAFGQGVNSGREFSAGGKRQTRRHRKKIKKTRRRY
jgi:hypothetical protein